MKEQKAVKISCVKPSGLPVEQFASVSAGIHPVFGQTCTRRLTVDGKVMELVIKFLEKEEV